MHFRSENLPYNKMLIFTRPIDKKAKNKAKHLKVIEVVGLNQDSKQRQAGRCQIAPRTTQTELIYCFLLVG